MIRISITKIGLATIGKNGFREIGRQAIGKAVLYWWENYLPLHFMPVAHVRYRAAHRDKRTNEMKQNREEWPFGENTERAVGEVKPLVFSGRSRERALSSPRIKTKAPNYENYVGEVIIDAPAFNFGVGKRIDMRDEVTRYTPQEEQAMDTIFTREWNRLLRLQGLRATRQTKTAA